MRIFRALIFFPAQRLHHARQNPVRFPQMPVVMESPNYQPVFLDEVPLLFPHRVVLIHSFRPVQVVVICRLVRDDQVFPSRRCPLQHVQRCHHRHRNPRHARLRISRFERIHCLRLPRHPNVFLNRRYHLLSGRSLFLRLRFRCAHRSCDQSCPNCSAKQRRRLPTNCIFPPLSHVALLSANLSVRRLPRLRRRSSALFLLFIFSQPCASCSSTTIGIFPAAAANSSPAPPPHKKYPAHRGPAAGQSRDSTVYTDSSDSAAPVARRCEFSAAQNPAASLAQSRSSRPIAASFEP